jgi:hypothetical protein
MNHSPDIVTTPPGASFSPVCSTFPTTNLIIPQKNYPNSTRPQRPIILCPFSLSLTTIKQQLSTSNNFVLICLLSSVLYTCKEHSTNQPYYAKQTQSLP